MTAQAHEILILDGEPASMASVPPIPADHPRIAPVPEEEVSAAVTSGAIQMPVLSTACWRRYVATWEIRDRRLYLLSIEGVYRVIGIGPVPADWFSGTLRVPRGRLLSCVHRGFESVYERDQYIDIEGGRETGRREIDNNVRDGEYRSPARPPER
ncbi:MAG TPA: hypothetical protein PKN50_03460 [Spirochaetota bacterium]|nr:hypothetical protein [Spirochaetota bacterium]HPV40721.1 hypothetical protein [Spirochaetota bacterium]